MRAAVYYSNSDVRVEEVGRPRIGPGDLLLRVRASGICGSDVMEWYRRPKAPLVLGHEVAGTVEAAGELVSRFKPGDRIVATHHVPCNRCRYCLTGRHAVCSTLHETSFEPGGFAEYVRVPALQVDRGTFRLPDGVDFESASFVEPLACVVRGQRIAGLAAGDRVAVLGGGISGLLHVMLARAAGASAIVVTDPDAFRREAALAAGADAALPPPTRDEDLELVFRAAGGDAFDRVIVATGAAPAFDQALALVDRGGSVLFFAPLPPGARLALPVNELWRRCVSIHHSYAGPPAEMRTALTLIERGTVDVGSLITHRFGLDGTAEGFRLTASPERSLKVVIDPAQASA